MDNFELSKIKSWISQAESGKVILTPFLDSNTQQVIKNTITKGLFLEFEGGYKDADYKRAFISIDNITPCFNICIVEIVYNRRYLTLTHRKVLGNLMAMGIKRDVVGDILIGEKSYIIFKKEFKDYFMDNIKQIDGKPISLIETDEVTVNSVDEGCEKLIFISSNRLDSILSQAYGLSRNISQEFIVNGLVKVNHMIVQNLCYKVKENDLISVRTKGRIKILSIGGNTKSGRLLVKIYIIR